MLTYVAPSSNIQAFSKQLSAVYGSDPAIQDFDSNEVHVWTLEVPSPISVNTKDVRKNLTTEIHLREAKQSVEGEVKRGTGLWEVAFWVSGDSGSANSKWGKIRYLSVDSA